MKGKDRFLGSRLLPSPLLPVRTWSLQMMRQFSQRPGAAQPTVSQPLQHDIIATSRERQICLGDKREVVVTEKKLIILQCSADHAFGGIG